jgi:uncharacterized membrane protein YwaF
MICLNAAVVKKSLPLRFVPAAMCLSIIWVGFKWEIAYNVRVASSGASMFLVLNVVKLSTNIISITANYMNAIIVGLPLSIVNALMDVE